MLKRVVLLIFVGVVPLFALQELERNYVVEGNMIMLSDLVQDPKEDLLLYSIEPSKNIKRVSSAELLERLKAAGYDSFRSSYSYIEFAKKSDVDLSSIEESLRAHFLSKYKGLEIKKITIRPKGYLKDLPSEYSFGIQEREYLKSSGYCFITTPTRSKIFFAYEIDAALEIYFSSKLIEKGSKLSALNLTKKRVAFVSFRASPLQDLGTEGFEAKHRVKKGTLLTLRDVVPLHLIKRGEQVNVTLQNGSLNISFSAKALSAGRLGETITVENSQKKRIKVRVIGKNRAEL